MIKQGLASGIIILLLGMSIIPSSIGLTLKEPYFTSVSGNTLYVGGTGPGNYSKIQDAIDNATSGDTVFVFKGEYQENVCVNKSINLVGEDKSITIINADYNGDVVFVTADDATITGFSLINSERGLYPGSGVWIESSDNIIIYDNMIVHNGYGLNLVNTSNTHVYDNSILDNLGVGIDLDSSSHNNISRNIVINMGTILLYNSCNNSIIDNEFKISFGGMDLKNSCNNTIKGNYVSKAIWQGICLWEDSNGNTLLKNTITDNDDYGIHLQSSFNNVSLNKITNNKRAGVAVVRPSNIISYNLIANNGEIGGIHLCSSYNVIYGNTVKNNYEHGVYIADPYNEIFENTIEGKHIGLGIYSSNNSVFRNNFMNHSNHVYCSYFGTITVWDDGEFGNYWDDYTGNDHDGDGIGDKPKSIERDSNQDRYPLMVPYGPNTSVRIITPLEGYIYVRNIRVLPFFWSLILGNIKIKASAANYQNEDVEIEKVEFYVDGLHRRTDTKAPYNWRWRLSSHIKHNHIISVVAYDTDGNTAVDERQVWRFF